MPAISNRGLKMPPSPIRKLTPYAEAAKARGIKVYHLNIGQPDIETPAFPLKAVRDSHFRVLAYTPSPGVESYRKKLTTYYSRYNIPLEASQVIVTTGGSEAIRFAFMSCLDPGDEILIPEPFYANYNGFSISAQVRIKAVTSSIDQAYALPPVEAFEALISEKTRAILICNPNNPTGYLYSREELEQLRHVCKKHDLFLFSDEAYREFCYEDTHFSALQLKEMEAHVVVLDTISKRYSACGARIGALVTRNPPILEAVTKFAQARLSPPTFAQIFAEAAVDVPQQYFEQVRTEYKARRDMLVTTLQQMKGVKCPLPRGAFYAMARLPIDDAEHFCQWLLEDFSYQGATVMLAPGSGFYSSPDQGKQEVRLAYVIHQNELKEALVCLKRALEVYPGRIVN